MLQLESAALRAENAALQQRFAAWLARATTSEIGELRRFAAGLREDQAA